MIKTKQHKVKFLQEILLYVALMIFQEEAVTMFKKIIHWVRVDPSGLGRKHLSGCVPTSPQAPPMGILNIIHEFDDLKGRKY